MVVGRVLKAHGVRGEVRVAPATDEPERFGWLSAVYVGESDPQPLAVEQARLMPGVVLLKLAGVDTREAANRLRGQWLWVTEAEALPLAPGEYFLFQLVGLRVVSDEGEHLGTVSEVIETGANNVILVQGSAGDLLLPDTPEVVLDIDFQGGQMRVHLLPGLR